MTEEKAIEFIQELIDYTEEDIKEAQILLNANAQPYDELEKSLEESKNYNCALRMAKMSLEEKIKPEPFVEYMQSSSWGNEKRFD